MKIPHYEIIGDQADGVEWITMLHGASQNSHLFSAQLDYFRRSHRLLLIDLPGHGGSSPMTGPYGQAEYTQAVVAALDDVGVQTTHLWGTHTGTAVSLLIARSQPDRVSSLVLEGAVLPGMAMPYVTHALERAKSTSRTRGVAAALAEWFNDCAWFDVIRSNPVACRAETHWQLLQTFAGTPWLDTTPPTAAPSLVEKLHQIQHPTLLVNGEFDIPEFLEVAGFLASQLPHAQRAIVPGAGGFPLWEFPLAVNSLVHRFLEAQRGAPR